MNCEYCGSPLKPGAQSCEHCGAQVSQFSEPAFVPPSEPVAPVSYSEPPRYNPAANPAAYGPSAPPAYGPAPAAAAVQIQDWLAIGSLLLGISGGCTLLTPFGACTPLFAVGGLVFGVLGLKSPRMRAMAIVGIVFNGLSILLSLAFFAMLVLYGLTNQGG